MGEKERGSTKEELRGGMDTSRSSVTGQDKELEEEESEYPSSVLLEEEVGLRLGTELLLWAASRVLSAVSNFLSNILLVS